MPEESLILLISADLRLNRGAYDGYSSISFLLESQYCLFFLD